MGCKITIVHNKVLSPTYTTQVQCSYDWSYILSNHFKVISTITKTINVGSYTLHTFIFTYSSLLHLEPGNQTNISTHTFLSLDFFPFLSRWFQTSVVLQLNSSNYCFALPSFLTCCELHFTACHVTFMFVFFLKCVP